MALRVDSDLWRKITFGGEDVRARLTQATLTAFGCQMRPQPRCQICRHIQTQICVRSGHPAAQEEGQPAHQEGGSSAGPVAPRGGMKKLRG